jgi:hypothetical protein
MRPLSRTLIPAVVLGTVIAANGAPGSSLEENPDATGSTSERSPAASPEQRRSPDPAPVEKRPVRVILPSPYSARP